MLLLAQGTWSRLDLQKNQAAFSKFALHRLTGSLPAQAHNIYFRDEIGNISSSNIRSAPAGAMLQVALQPSWLISAVSLPKAQPVVICAL